MKKIAATLLVALSFTGLVFACGGMTQIDPPSLQRPQRGPRRRLPRLSDLA